MRISKERAASVRAAIRRGAAWLCGAAFVAIFLGVIGEFFIKLAEQQGWYSDPKRTLEAALSWLWWLALSPAALVLYGLAAGLWLDGVLRRLAEASNGDANKGLKTFAILNIERDMNGISSFRRNRNISHIEESPNGRLTIEFKEPVPHRLLTARIAGSDKEVELMEVTSLRAVIWPDPFQSFQIVFEAPY